MVPNRKKSILWALNAPIQGIRADATWNCRRVLVYVCMHVREFTNGQSTVNVKTMSAELGMPIRTVNQSLKRLIDLELIKPDRYDYGHDRRLVIDADGG